MILDSDHPFGSDFCQRHNFASGSWIPFWMSQEICSDHINSFIGNFIVIYIHQLFWKGCISSHFLAWHPIFAALNTMIIFQRGEITYSQKKCKSSRLRFLLVFCPFSIWEKFWRMIIVIVYVFEMVSKIMCCSLNMEVQQSLDGSKLQSGQRLRMDRKYVLGHVSCFVNIII